MTNHKSPEQTLLLKILAANHADKLLRLIFAANKTIALGGDELNQAELDLLRELHKSLERTKQ